MGRSSESRGREAKEEERECVLGGVCCWTVAVVVGSAMVIEVEEDG